jgi:hypothetical protein
VMSRSLAILMLGAACLLVIACQTAGTPPQSLATAQTQAPPPSSQTAAVPQAPPPSSQTAAVPQAPPPSSQTAAVPQAPPPARSANRNGTARYSGSVVPAISAQVKKFMSGTAKMLGKLYDTVAGPKKGSAGAIEYAAVAAIVVAVGATATVLVRRHRKLTPSSQ